MTQTELLNTIRAHIDQQYEGNREKARYDDYYRGMNDGLDKLEQFLDTLQEPEVDLNGKVTFDCISKKVTMTIQELINYYIDTECCNVAEECGF